MIAAVLCSLAASAEGDDGNWWSLVPLAKVAVPRDRRSLDSHVRRRVYLDSACEQERLAPSAEADRRTLIRRLDLRPARPAADAGGDRRVHRRHAATMPTRTLVDRLLASPRYGERWGRHWLDIVHFGESHGYDKDKPRPNAWPYRDYVIDSLNGDKPYDRFVEEQIAGDVLYPDDPRAVTATGFIAAGPWDFVGHVELREGTVDKDIARSNDRDDMVAGAMSTFVSLTVHCARCHDHKFDPIRQEDYYALQAVFAGVDRADRPYEPDADTARDARALLSRQAEIEAWLVDAAVDRSRTRRAIAALELELLGRRRADWPALPPRKMVYAAASRSRPTCLSPAQAAADSPAWPAATSAVRNSSFRRRAWPACRGRQRNSTWPMRTTRRSAARRWPAG